MLRIFKVAAVLGALLLVVGYFRGWFSISRPDTNEYSVRLDRDKIGDDTAAARGLASKMGNRLAGRRVTGNVKYLNPLTLSLVITDSKDEEHSFKMSGDTRITRAGETAGLLDLADLSKIAVTFADADGEKQVREIEIID